MPVEKKPKPGRENAGGAEDHSELPSELHYIIIHEGDRVLQD